MPKEQGCAPATTRGEIQEKSTNVGVGLRLMLLESSAGPTAVEYDRHTLPGVFSTRTATNPSLTFALSCTTTLPKLKVSARSSSRANPGACSGSVWQHVSPAAVRRGARTTGQIRPHGARIWLTLWSRSCRLTTRSGSAASESARCIESRPNPNLVGSGTPTKNGTITWMSPVHGNLESQAKMGAL